MPRKKIAVYTGQSVSTGELMPRLRDSFRGAVVHTTGAADLINKQSLDNNTLAFVLPGIVGEESPYPAEIGPLGNAAIRRYVEAGGVFIGVCAGAYYASADILYDPPWRAVPKRRKPGLDFFNALAHGPQPGLAVQGDKDWFSDCRVVNVSYRDEQGKERRTGVAYGNGPALYSYEVHDDMEVLARYEDVPGKPPAIAVKKVGKGLAIFTGVLPMIGYHPKMAVSAPEDLKKFMEALRPHEQGREDLWNLIVDRIKQHHADLGRVSRLRAPEPAPGNL